jgi:bisphosphoglycerate-dependent phosphoglycerate mutase
MMLDHLSPSEVIELELATGIPIAYELDVAGEVISKTILND